MESSVKRNALFSLKNTLDELETRSEIQDVMQSILMDVELSASLSNQLSSEAERDKQLHQIQHCHAFMQDAQAQRLDQQEEKQQLAEDFCQELWGLAKTLGELKQWKSEKAPIVEQHDGLRKQLEDTQRELELLKRKHQEQEDLLQTEQQQQQQQLQLQQQHALFQTQQQRPNSDSTTSTAPERQQDINVDQTQALTDEEDEMIQQAIRASLEESYKAQQAVEEEKEKAQVKPAAVPTTATIKEDVLDDPNTVITEKVTEDDKPNVGENEEPPPLETESVASEVEAEDEGAPPSAVVELIPEEPISLAELELNILRKVTSFLDPLDILNLAQVNLGLYSLVDLLFEDDPDGAGEDFQPSQPPLPTKTSPAAPPQPTPKKPAPAAVPTIVSPPPILKTAPPPPQTSTATSSIAVKKPITSSMVPPSSATSSIGSRTGSSRTGSSRPAAGLFGLGLLQTRAVAPNEDDQQQQQQQTGQSNLVESMTEKLTPKEISAIISMREQLHRTQHWLAEEQQAHEDLKNRIGGLQKSNTYTRAKVKELESSLRSKKDDDIKVTQQIASDQEVIAFLDGRVQELEGESLLLTDEKRKMNVELEKAQRQHSKKLQVMGDMLQFERERLRDNEKEWKHSKKLLIKEIKSCRAQLLLVQAERDGFQEQNERLKRALQGSSEER